MILSTKLQENQVYIQVFLSIRLGLQLSLATPPRNLSALGLLSSIHRCPPCNLLMCTLVTWARGKSTLYIADFTKNKLILIDYKPMVAVFITISSTQFKTIYYHFITI